jgi:hypothetical protein
LILGYVAVLIIPNIVHEVNYIKKKGRVKLFFDPDKNSKCDFILNGIFMSTAWLRASCLIKKETEPNAIFF